MCLFHTFYDIPSPGQSSRAVIETEKYRPRLRQVQDGHGENDKQTCWTFSGFGCVAWVLSVWSLRMFIQKVLLSHAVPFNAFQQLGYLPINNIQECISWLTAAMDSITPQKTLCT